MLRRLRAADAELEALWGMAGCAAFPTRAEGFGLPVLEAMLRGVPVACSDLPVLREVGGELPFFFDPDDPGDAARAVESGLARRGRCRGARRVGGPLHLGGRGRGHLGRLRARAGRLMLHVGLNLVFLVPGETGGMETAARELIPHLAAHRRSAADAVRQPRGRRDVRRRWRTRSWSR